MPVSRRLVGNAIAARLADQVTNAVGYYGQIGRPLVRPVPYGWVPDPPIKGDGDDSVQPYYVLYPGAGGPGEDQDVGDSVDDLDLLVRITAAGGDVEDVLALVDRIDAALYRWTPAVDGHVLGRLRPPPGYEAPQLIDVTFRPHRPYVPLQYQLPATT